MKNFEKALSNRIAERINVRGFCVVFDHELAQLCAPDPAFRQKQIRLIERFAAKNALAVCIRDVGINATFKKRSHPGAQTKINGNGARVP